MTALMKIPKYTTPFPKGRSNLRHPIPMVELKLIVMHPKHMNTDRTTNPNRYVRKKLIKK